MGYGNQLGGGLFHQQQPWRMPQQQTPAIDPNTPFDNPMHFNDPRYPLMWYVNRGGMLDMNVQDRVATKTFEGFGDALFKEFIKGWEASTTLGLEPVSIVHYTRP